MIMLDFLKGIDVEKTDKETVELLKSMSEAIENRMAEYLKGTISNEVMEKAISDALAGIDNKEELKSVKEQITDVKETLVRMKGAFEVKNNRVEVKSIEEQIGEQLKEYISVQKGSQLVDLKRACKESAGNKKVIELVIDSKAASVTSGSVAPTFGNFVDTSLSVEPKAQSVIRSFANVTTTAERNLTYAEFVPGEGDAEWVPEGGLKPSMNATLQEQVVKPGKVALTVKLTEETLSDLPQLVAEIRAEIINRIGLAEEIGILTGDGTNGKVKGIASVVPGFSLTSLKIKHANTYDAIVAAYTQILSVSEMSYRPNLVLINPIDYANMQTSKDLNGQYLRPFRAGDELIPGLRVEASTAIAVGDIWIGDFNYLNIRDLWTLTIQFGWENDDFTRNLVTMVGEKRLMVYIKKQYQTAFVKDTINNIIAGITEE